MSYTSVEIELERERDELKSIVIAAAWGLADIEIDKFSIAERTIFKKLCEAGFMRNENGIAILI